MVVKRQGVDAIEERNSVQGRILQASARRCGNYQQFIHNLDTNVSFWLGFSSLNRLVQYW